MLQSLSVMLMPSVATPWAHSFAPVKLALPEMDSGVPVRKTRKTVLIIAYPRPTERYHSYTTNKLIMRINSHTSQMQM